MRHGLTLPITGVDGNVSLLVDLAQAAEDEVTYVSDLLVYSLDELEAIAAEKGSIRQLLDEQWRKVYKASAPRGMFSEPHQRRAA
jgi:hypothetical protein